MKKYIVITADMNDGDYTTEISLIKDIEEWITKEEIEQLFTKLGNVLKEHSPKHGHNWPTYDGSKETPYTLYSGYLTEEEIETIQELGYIPYGEDGIHTIKSIEILTVIEKLKLL